MLIRSIVAILAIVLFIPIAVFLRPAYADPAPQITVVKVCNTPVAIYVVHKGMGTFYIMEGLIQNDAELEKIIRLTQHGNIQTYKADKWLGLNCPVQM